MIQPRVIVVATRCGISAILESMYGYQSLDAWKRAHQAAMLILRETSRANHPRTFALYDQLRRAALSVPANIVEGYALGTPALYRKHLRIALGSAAEAEYFLRVAAELGYLPRPVVVEAVELLGGAMRALFGLIRRPHSLRLSHTPHPTPHAS